MKRALLPLFVLMPSATLANAFSAVGMKNLSIDQVLNAVHRVHDLNCSMGSRNT